MKTGSRKKRRDSKLYTYNGQTMTIREWANELGVTLSAMRKRAKAKLPPEEMFSPDRRVGNDYGKYKGKYYRKLEREVDKRIEESISADQTR